MKVTTVSLSSLAMGIPAYMPESFAGQEACSLNSPLHPARGEGGFVSRLRNFHIKALYQVIEQGTFHR